MQAPVVELFVAAEFAVVLAACHIHQALERQHLDIQQQEGLAGYKTYPEERHRTRRALALVEAWLPVLVKLVEDVGPEEGRDMASVLERGVVRLLV